VGLFLARARPLRAYRWGEDVSGDIGQPPEAMPGSCTLEWQRRHPEGEVFGLTGGEGNHGEDVKEYYYYLDNTPSHSYMKYLYKYPRAFPYSKLVDENKGGKHDLEFDLSIREFSTITAISIS
jgi:hypothetical protein